MPELKFYTVKQLREWLLDNKLTEGLDEQIIAPTRAWAIIHNPYVTDDDTVVAAIFEDGKLSAYTAAFPEILERCIYKSDLIKNNRIWWFSTLWCSPENRGKGYGLLVVRSLAEKYGEQFCWDRTGVPETMEIFKYLGNNALETHRFILGDKSIKQSTIKGKIAFVIQAYKKCLKRHQWRGEAAFKVQYLTHFDAESYTFIKNHSSGDIFLRTREMLNWVYRYPFMQSCPLMENADLSMEFHSMKKKYIYYLVRIMYNEQIVGIYMLREKDDVLSLIYCYLNEKYNNLVYESIIHHIHRLGINQFETENMSVATYIRDHYFFPKMIVKNIQLLYPTSALVSDQSALQMGDGDYFA